jgi:hypothetical protein
VTHSLRRIFARNLHGALLTAFGNLSAAVRNPLPNHPAALVDEFRRYYGPTMNACDTAEKNGRAADLQRELEELFVRQNQRPTPANTSIPATFLRVTVQL